MKNGHHEKREKIWVAEIKTLRRLIGRKTRGDRTINVNILWKWKTSHKPIWKTERRQLGNDQIDRFYKNRSVKKSVVIAGKAKVESDEKKMEYILIGFLYTKGFVENKRTS